MPELCADIVDGTFDIHPIETLGMGEEAKEEHRRTSHIITHNRPVDLAPDGKQLQQLSIQL